MPKVLVAVLGLALFMAASGCAAKLCHQEGTNQAKFDAHKAQCQQSSADYDAWLSCMFAKGWYYCDQPPSNKPVWQAK